MARRLSTKPPVDGMRVSGDSAAVDRIVVRSGFAVRHIVASSLRLAQHAAPSCTTLSVLRGEMTATVNRRSAAAHAGETLLIDASRPRAFEATEAEVVLVELSLDVLEELLVEMGWYRAGVIPLFRSPVVSDDAILALARSLGAELAAERPGRGAMVDALVRQLAVHLLRDHVRLSHMPEVELSRVGPVDRRLRRAVELMHDRCAEPLSLKDLAASVFLSEHYFAHLFKEVTGVTPHAYLASLRMERARTLLAGTDLPIAEVAARVGYRSPSHFAHAFRAVTGASPRAYRAAASA